MRTGGAELITGAVATMSRDTRTRFCCTGCRETKAVRETAVNPPGASQLR